MGIRFACHHCNHPLNLKDFQAGKRGKCPACNQSFRIPLHSTDYSIPLEEKGVHTPTSTPAIVSASAETKGTTAGMNKAAIGSNVKIVTKSSAVTTSKRDEKNAASNRSEIKLRQSNEARPSPTGVQKDLAKSLEKDESKSLSMQESNTPAKKVGSVSAFEANPSAQWYVRPPSGGQYGPADSKLLAQWIAENRVTADSLIWFDGLTQWTAATAIMPELFPGASEAISASVAIQSSEGMVNESDQDSNDSGRLLNTSSINSVAKPIRSKQKQKRNQWIIIAILISVCLCLLVGLVAVLMFKK
ncbi:MAG: DUF4339 domain-containing protein [Pirellula sp.]|jgi:hypothetical protein|nr:DUF4339 domain-containing protein [Pirellula sp.]